MFVTDLIPREVSTNVGETNVFTIKANSKAFKVLIDGLYSDKIRSIIREIWSNAFDSHVAAGIPEQPFDCQLPTRWELSFRVRDYGVSLSHEDVMHLYTTVFESTKDSTNTQVGKLGLGSKSPFAYIDTFGVTAWLNGEKRIYSAYIGEDHVPRISLMSQEPSDEPRGFEVSFSCKADDVEAFKGRARVVGLGFDVLPNITGATEVFSTLETVMEDQPLWRLVKSDDYYFKSGVAYARQGCVVYPIDASSIPGVTDTQAAILRSPFFIEFPIGDLEITANREALGYDAATCKNILAVVDIIAQDIATQYQQEISRCSTYWEALQRFAMMQKSSLNEGVRKSLATNLRYRGRKLKTSVSLGRAMNHARETGGVAVTHISDRTFRRRIHLKWEPSSYAEVTPATARIFLEDTTTKKRCSMAGARIRYNTSGSDLLGERDIVWFKGDPKSMSWRRILATLGKPPVIVVNDLEKPPVGVKCGQRKPVRMRTLTSKGKFIECDIDEEDNVIYVDMERGDVYFGTRGFSADAVARARDYMVELGQLWADTPIIGVPRSHANVIKRNAHWMNFWDLCTRSIDYNFDAKAAARAEAFHMLVHAWDELGWAVALKGGVFKRGPARSILALYERAQGLAASLQTMRTWRAFAALVCPTATAAPAFNIKYRPLAEKFNTTYPLAGRVLNHTLNDDERIAFIDYVNLIDERNAKVHSVKRTDTRPTS